MDRDHDSHQGQVRLPGYGAAGSATRAAQPGGDDTSGAARTRNDGIRRVRRMSNWTAAALLVGTGATAVALAHNAFPVGTSATGTTSTGAVTATGAHGTAAPQVGGPVATSGGSGVTVTTTSHVVNGKTVVTKVTHPAANHDH
jgi:hypothetical protein